MAQNNADQSVESVRRFNRFYTRQIGVLNEGLLKSQFSLTEVRVLYELAHCEQSTATELCKELGLDAGYMSRLLQTFKKRGLIESKPAESDARQSVLRLTKHGQTMFASLNARASQEIRTMLADLSTTDQGRLIEAMHTIEQVLGAQPEHTVPCVLRPHQSGDMGWVVHRHGVVYAQEYGWNEEFEALVASVTAEFIQKYDPKRERCWIAEQEGQIIGSVFLVKKSKTVGKLRLLLVEPQARGLGLGSRLVKECIRFARQAGYRKITLWTNSVLLAARRIYEREGFQLVHEEPHHSFGHDLIGETWELEL